MLSNLNPQQKEVVLSENHVLLTACPGSGKTRVLTYKLAHELNKLPEESRKRLIAVTFTNRASDEIKKRLEYLDLDIKNLWAGTIHSFCLEWIIRPYSCYSPRLKNGYILADENLQDQILEEAKEKYNIEFLKQSEVRPTLEGKYPTNYTGNKLKAIKYYHKRLIEEKLIDFDLILFFANKLLQKYPQISRTLNSLFHIICVDEYQDTQELQYQIITQIIKAKDSGTKLFMVGDPDQAIYGSLGSIAKTGAEISSMINNELVSEFDLSGNYRSSQRLVDFYSEFQNKKIDIEAVGEKKDTLGIITYNHTIDKDNLVDEIVNLIKTSLEEGVPETEICVLAPQWWLVIPMARKLKTELPDSNFDAYGLSPIGRNKENFWFKLARLLLTTQTPKLYLVRIRWAKELIEELESIKGELFPDIEKKHKKILRIVNSASSESSEGKEFLIDCFNYFLSETELTLDDDKQLKIQWQSFFEGIDKRINDENYDYGSDVESFRAVFRERSGIVINTCAGVKGEEFHTVIAFGILQGYIPHWDNIINKSNDESEEASRKMLYVISSRAKEYLHLISETGRRTQSRRSYQANNQLDTYSYDFYN